MASAIQTSHLILRPLEHADAKALLRIYQTALTRDCHTLTIIHYSISKYNC